jgi:hypothetical protein
MRANGVGLAPSTTMRPVTVVAGLVVSRRSAISLPATVTEVEANSGPLGGVGYASPGGNDETSNV